MKYRSISFSLVSLFMVMMISCSAGGREKSKFVTFTTSMGEIKIRLYNDTPLHRDNMVNLVKSGYYDGIKFHRIINEFMIQAGDPTTREDLTEADYEKYEYTVPAEINTGHFHRKGVLAAARIGDRFNPERNSSGTQFYIVQGRPLDSLELNQIEVRVNATLKQGIFYRNLMNEKERVQKEGDSMSDAEIEEFAAMISYDEMTEMEPFTISPERREVYSSLGGTPHLDTQYTIFGEVVEGIEIVDSIAAVATDRNGKPDNDVIIIKAKISGR